MLTRLPLSRILSLALLMGLCFGWTAPAAMAQGADETAPPASLPAFSFTTLDGGTVTKADLKPGLPTVVMFFDPYCDHCKKQAADLVKGQDQLPKAQYLFVSTEELGPIADFKKAHFGGFRHPITFAKDAQYRFDGWFGYSVVPTLVIFNAQGKTVKKVDHELSVAELKALLK